MSNVTDAMYTITSSGTLTYNGEVRVIDYIPSSLNGYIVTKLDFHYSVNAYITGVTATIPSSITNIDELFRGCTSLINAPVIPSSVTSMKATFWDCTSLINAPVIPISVTSVTHLFKGCTKLVTAPIITNSLTNISYMFLDCTSLVNAPVIPSSIGYMNNTFQGCTKLVTTPVIPSSVINISGSFKECTSLVNAPVIPSSVKYMDSTFQGCTKLVTAPIIPSSVINLEYAFRYCTLLTGTIFIPKSVTSIVSNTFLGTSKPINVLYGSENTIVPATTFPSNVTKNSLPMTITWQDQGVNSGDTQKLTVTLNILNPVGLTFQYGFYSSSTGTWTTSGSSTTSTSVVLSGVPDSSTYHPRVIVSSSSGEYIDNLYTSTSVVVPNRTAPPVPTGLSAVWQDQGVNSGDTQKILITCAIPSGATKITYQLNKTNGTVFWQNSSQTSGSTTVISNVPDSDSYTVYTRSEDAQGNYSAWVNVNVSVPDRTAPATSIVPVLTWQDQGVNSGDTQKITMTLSAIPTGAIKLQFGYYSDVTGGSVTTAGWQALSAETTALSYVFTGIPDSSNIQPKVRAIDASGNYSETAGTIVAISNRTAPPGPTGLIAVWQDQGVNSGDTQKILVTCTIPSGATKLFHGVYKTNGTSYYTNNVQTTGNTALFTSIPDNDSIKILTRSEDAQGNYSAWVETFVITTNRTAPIIPILTTTGGAGAVSKRIYITMVNPIVAGVIYNLYYRALNTTTWVLLANNQSTYNASVGTGLVYEFYVLSTDASGNTSQSIIYSGNSLYAPVVDTKSITSNGLNTGTIRVQANWTATTGAKGYGITIYDGFSWYNIELGNVLSFDSNVELIYPQVLVANSNDQWNRTKTGKQLPSSLFNLYNRTTGSPHATKNYCIWMRCFSIDSAGVYCGTTVEMTNVYEQTTTPDNDSPNPPTSVSVVPYTDGFKLTSNGSTDKYATGLFVGSGIKDYEYTINGVVTTGLAVYEVHNSVAYSPNTSYPLKIRTTDNSGNTSDYFTTSIVTAPQVPTAFTAVPVSTAINSSLGKVQLDWTSINPPDTSYKLFRSTDNVTFAEIANTTSKTFTDNVVDNTLYYYKLSIYYKSSSSWQDTGLLAQAITLDRTAPGIVNPTITWQDQGVNSGDTQKLTVSVASMPAGATKLQYGYFTNTSNTWTLVSPETTALSFQFTNMLDNVGYNPWVRAIDASGNYSDNKYTGVTTNTLNRTAPTTPTMTESTWIDKGVNSGDTQSITTQGTLSIVGGYLKAEVVNSVGTLQGTQTRSGTGVLTFNNISDNDTYTVRLRTEDAQGNYSIWVNTTVVIPSRTYSLVTPSTSHFGTVSGWTQRTNNTLQGVYVGYILQSQVSSVDMMWKDTTTGSEYISTYSTQISGNIVKDLIPHKSTYNILARYCDSIGNYSEYMQIGTVIIPDMSSLEVPASLVLVWNDQGVNSANTQKITCTLPAYIDTRAINWEIHYNTLVTSKIISATRSFVLTPLLDSTTYNVYYIITDIYGNTATSLVSGVTIPDRTKPAIPVITSATWIEQGLNTGSAQKVRLVCTTSETSEVRWEITTQFNGTIVVNYAGSQNTVDVLNLSDSQVIQVKAQCRDAQGNYSLLSSETSITIPDRTSPVTPVTSTISWIDKGINSTNTQQVRVSVASLLTDVNTVEYSIWTGTTMLQSMVVGKTELSYTFSNVADNIVVFGKVRTFDTSGNYSPYSSSSSVSILDRTPPIATTMTITANPMELNSSKGWIEVSITPSSGVVSSNIYYKNITSDTWILIDTLLTAGSVSLMNLLDSTSYHARVVSYDSQGNFVTSTSSTVVTPDRTSPTPPSVSMSIQTGEVNTGIASVVISWDSFADDLGGYEVRNKNNTLISTRLAQTETSFLIEDAPEGESVQYTVRRYDASGNYSNSQTIVSIVPNRTAQFSNPEAPTLVVLTTGVKATSVYPTASGTYIPKFTKFVLTYGNTTLNSPMVETPSYTFTGVPVGSITTVYAIVYDIDGNYKSSTTTDILVNLTPSIPKLLHLVDNPVLYNKYPSFDVEVPMDDDNETITIHADFYNSSNVLVYSFTSPQVPQGVGTIVVSCGIQLGVGAYSVVLYSYDGFSESLKERHNFSIASVDTTALNLINTIPNNTHVLPAIMITEIVKILDTMAVSHNLSASSIPNITNTTPATLAHLEVARNLVSQICVVRGLDIPVWTNKNLVRLVSIRQSIDWKEIYNELMKI